MQTNILTPQQIFFNIVRYEIPVFQRPYIWTQEDQWEPLWEDVSDIAADILENGGESHHFMGAIVLQQRPTPAPSIATRVVVDGQQRLTTLQLLIDAIQEICEQQEHSGAAERLRHLVHTPEAYHSGNPDSAFKVWPTIYDQAAFRHAMKNDLSSDEYKSSRIVSAHNYFKNKTEQFLEGSQHDRAAEALERAVCHCLELVVIDLGQSDDAHIIFEPLNARGTPLLPSDMIKNQIFHEAGISSDDDYLLSEEATRLWGFSEYWWRQEVGRGHQRRPRIDGYLNNWLTLRNRSETKAHREFETFGDYVKEAKQAGTTIQEVATDIGRLGEIYRKIDERGFQDFEQFLYRRQVIGIGAMSPVLLWLLSSEVPRPQIGKSFTALESYIVRRMACGMSARSYGQLFIGLIGELEESGPQQAGDTVVRYLAQQQAFANVWPGDEDLLQAFAEPLYWSLTTGRLNLILQGIEGELRRTSMTECQPVPRNLHIEHVMPQGWRPDVDNDNRWPLQHDIDNPNAVAAKRDRLIHSIGNLTLVTQRLNSSLSNAPWTEKRGTLKIHSQLFLNKDLIYLQSSRGEERPKWDESTIDERRKRLHQAAIKVWPHADAVQ